jgi:acyl-CoA thioester hydrolase
MKVFETEIRVRFNEVDQWGIVYYANYFTYIEVARAELLEKVGLLPTLLSGIGYTAPIVSLHSDFRSSAVFNEVLTVQLSLIPQTTAKLVFSFKISSKNTGKVVMEGESTQVLLNEKGFMVFLLEGDLAGKMADLYDFFEIKEIRP